MFKKIIFVCALILFPIFSYCSDRNQIQYFFYINGSDGQVFSDHNQIQCSLDINGSDGQVFNNGDYSNLPSTFEEFVKTESLGIKNRTQLNSNNITIKQLSTCNFSKKSKISLSEKPSQYFKSNLQNDFCYYYSCLKQGSIKDFPYASYQGYVFHQFNMYQFKGFRDYVKTLTGFEDWVDEVNDFFWVTSNCKKNRNKFRNKLGFKKYGFVGLFADLKKEIESKRETEAIATEQRIKEEQVKRKEEWFKNEINKNQESIVFNDVKNSEVGNVQNYKSSILEYDHDNDLVQVAQRQIELFETELEKGSRDRVIVYKKRVESIIQSLQNPDKQIKQVYKFDNHTREYIKYYNLNIGRLTQLEGNFVEQNIHEEVVNVIKNISNTMYAFDNKLNTDNIAQIIFESSDITLDLKDNKKYDRAYSLLDVVNGILNIGKQSLLVVGEGILKAGDEFSSEIKNGLDFLINASGEDLVNGTLDIARGLYYLIRTSPISLDHGLDKVHIPDLADPLEKNENFFPNYIDYCISKIHYGDQNKQFPSYKEWKPLAVKQFEILDKEREAYWDLLKTDPRQFAVDTVAELTKLFLYCGLGEIATFKIGQLARSLSNAMLYESMLLAEKVRTLKASANGIYDVMAVKVAEAPLLSSIKVTEDVICKAVQYGDQNVANALEVIKKNSSILTQEGKAVVQVVQEIADNAHLRPNPEYKPKTPKGIIKDFNAESLQKHFKKHVLHKAEWGTKCNMTIDQYAERAKQLLSSSVSEDVEGFVSQNGFIFRYNKSTNEFATAKPNGIIETLFRPKQGEAYWKEQVEIYKS